MIVFQVSLNFDPVKEILKIPRHIYILMKKVIMHVTMESFAPPFSTIKKLNIMTLQLPIYYMLYWNIGISIRISIGANADIARTKREKGIVIVVKRWMQACYFG